MSCTDIMGVFPLLHDTRGQCGECGATEYNVTVTTEDLSVAVQTSVVHPTFSVRSVSAAARSVHLLPPTLCWH